MLDMLDAALSYARRGWRVFPCIAKSKLPMTAHGFEDATTNEDQIRRWWTAAPNANIAIATGAGLVVVDMDIRHSGGDTLANWALKGWVLPAGPVARTGGGGQHFYLSANDVGCFPAIGHGIDLKGNGGYVVAPPSLHPSGNPYLWFPDAGSELDLPPAPQWLWNLLTHKPSTTKAAPLPDAITEGQRNALLTSLAGSLRRRGASVDAIEAALLVENRQRCQPALADNEVHQIAVSVGRYATGTPPPPHLGLGHQTDASNAEYLARLYGDQIRYDHRRGRWLVWAGHRWQPDSNGESLRLALESARQRFRDSENIPDLKARSQVATWAISSQNRPRLEAALAIARCLYPIADSGEHWDEDPWLLGTQNGVVDLQSGALRPGRPEDRITMSTGVSFNPTTPCPRGLRFMQEVFGQDAELIHWLHKALGYCLTGITTEQTFFLNWGRGSNGKTTLREIIALVLGDYAENANFSSFEANQRSSIPNDIACLVAKRFVSASETSGSTKLNEARLKALSGQDTITARFLHCEFFSFQPTFKLWLAANHRPRVNDDSHAFWRRVRLIPYLYEFPLDKALKDELAAEGEGILRWMVEGCLLWQREGLEPAPEKIRVATEDYRAESDDMRGFIADTCIESRDASVQAATLYIAYKKWAAAQGRQENEALSATAFGRKLREGYQKVRRRDGVFYQGLGLSVGFSVGFEATITKNLTAPDAPCPRCSQWEWAVTEDGRFYCSQCEPQAGKP